MFAFVAVRRAAAAMAGVAGVAALSLAWPAARAAPASTDLDRVCPGARAQLAQRLAGAWPDRQEEGAVRVRFGVEGDRITRLVVRDLRGDYRDFVRKALGSLSCRATGEATTHVEFDIVFLPPDATRPAGAGR